jgi:hypothetical protein
MTPGEPIGLLLAITYTAYTAPVVTDVAQGWAPPRRPTRPPESDDDDVLLLVSVYLAMRDK